MEYQGALQSAVFQAIEEKVRRNTKQVLEEMTTREILPREAAADLAIQRLKRCMSYRRWSLFSSAPSFV
jgi:glutamate dehydrogenase (NAD(P)+)